MLNTSQGQNQSANIVFLVTRERDHAGAWGKDSEAGQDRQAVRKRGTELSTIDRGRTRNGNGGPKRPTSRSDADQLQWPPGATAMEAGIGAEPSIDGGCWGRQRAVGTSYQSYSRVVETTIDAQTGWKLAQLFSSVSAP